MQITIVRHGKPDFNWKRSVKENELGNLVKDYDAAGIIDLPPENLKSLVNQHNYIVCSNLPRSIQSAKAIGARKIHLSDSIFKEMSIPHLNQMKIKLPVKVWAVLLRVLWFIGFSKNTESISIAKNRAKQAAQKLIELANKHESILLVGHGFTNHYIAKELLANNWAGSSSPGKKYWEFGVYKKNLNP